MAHRRSISQARAWKRETLPFIGRSFHGNNRARSRSAYRQSGCVVGNGMEREFIRSSDRARKEEDRAETISNFRLLRAERMAGTKSCRAIGGKCRSGISGATSRQRVIEKGNQGAGKNREAGVIVISIVGRERL